MDVIVNRVSGRADFSWLAGLPVQEIRRDWNGILLLPPARFAFGQDDNDLWFLASRDKKASIHPASRPGEFQEELWKYDTAEWFLYNPDSQLYREFNLSPNGAWWTSVFSSPRLAAPELSTLANVETRSEIQADAWTAMARIPLSSLAPIVNEPGGDDAWERLRLTAAFILESPSQIFLTSSAVLGGQPDFHLPATFSKAIPAWQDS